jgi:hypothetical protein
VIFAFIFYIDHDHRIQQAHLAEIKVKFLGAMHHFFEGISLFIISRWKIRFPAGNQEEQANAYVVKDHPFHD